MTPTHTQKLECSLTGYPLSLCVFGCGGGAPLPFPAVIVGARRVMTPRKSHRHTHAPEQLRKYSRHFKS